MIGYSGIWRKGWVWVGFLSYVILSACAGSPTQTSGQAPDKTTGQADTKPPPIIDDPWSHCTVQTPLVEGIPGSPNDPIPSDINPNGDSELGWVMREMLADLQQARLSVEHQKPLPPERVVPNRMRCAWPTDPGTRNGVFDVMAQAYVTSWEHLKLVPAQSMADRVTAYNGVVNSCVGCHTQFCQGPIPMIEGLLIRP